MARAPRYHPDFDLDVLDGANWYKRSSRVLAFDFTRKVEEAVLDLIDHPERRTAFKYGLRYWPVVRFPHLIFYDFTASEVLLIGVFHPSQEPDSWLARRR